jgi:hypothetical protein
VITALIDGRESISPEDLVIACLLYVVAISIVFVILILIMKDKQKAALAATLIAIALPLYKLFETILNGIAIFFYVFVASSFDLTKLDEINPSVKYQCGWALDIVALALFSTALIFTVRIVSKGKLTFAKHSYDIDFNAITANLNIILAALLVINVGTYIDWAIDDSHLSSAYQAEAFKQFENVKLKTVSDPPDVYYIILDACAGTSTLKNYLGYDNSEFLSKLRGKGFYVVPDAFSNYDRTMLSLSGSLNMQYTTSLTVSRKLKMARFTNFARMMQNNCLVRLLKPEGYKFINVKSGSWGTDFIPSADANYGHEWATDTNVAILALTPMRSIDRLIHVVRDSFVNLRMAPDQYLPEIVLSPGPKFVLMHNTLSHPPYVVDRQGNRLDLDFSLRGDRSKNVQPYVDQIKFCEARVLNWIDYIQKHSRRPPVIVIQGDHGPWFQLWGEVTASHDGIEGQGWDNSDYLKERMRILHAICFPGQNEKGLYPGISPVNTFRVLLNDYFDANLPMLPDKPFILHTEEWPSQLFDVSKPLSIQGFHHGTTGH